jgi:hypothetical protein
MNDEMAEDDREGPVCQDCGLRHAPEDHDACIEGHGDDAPWVRVTIDLTLAQAQQWVRWLRTTRQVNTREARQMTTGLQPGDILVYNDWATGRVEILVT